MKILFPLLAALALYPAAAQAQASDSPVRFDISCSAEAQAEFNRGVELLHSFEYPATTMLFDNLLEQEPDCVMVRWGAAMSIWHPLWAPPSPADLDRGMRLLGEVDLSALTARERAYFNALRTFFASNDATTHRERVRAYEAAMADVYAEHLADPEAAIFYALALLASADATDKSYANQFKAAGLLNWVGQKLPQHPGVLHYTIHAYDFPGLAHLALPAALVYARSAPDSAHAQHMPSHIFTRLGMWDHSLASNHDSARSAEQFTQQAGLSGHYDEGLHSMDYLMYAMLQTARDEDAAALLEKLEAIEKTNLENFKVAFSYAAAPARFTIERRQWKDAAGMELSHPAFPWGRFAWAEAIHHFAKGLGAARSGNDALAERQLARLRELQASLAPTTLPYWQVEVEVQIEALRAWIAWGRGDQEEALTLARAAADREDAVDKHPVTPGEIVPARELLAELLLLSGSNQAALAEYETVLRGSPGRLNALLGAAAAAANSGQLEKAEALRQQAVDQAGEGALARAASFDH